MAEPSSVKKLIDTAVIIESKGTHRHSIIWLHGFGDSADGCKGLFPSMQLSNTRVVLPNAPKRWATIEGRQYHMQSWYELDKTAIDNRLQVLESVKELIDDELKLVENASHIIIGGFSQGACLALFTGLTYRKQQLGGVICASGQLMLEDKIPELLSEYANKVPILVLHGKDDNRISWDTLKAGLEILKVNGIKDNLQVVVEDGVAHTISQRGFFSMILFISKQFKF